MFHRPFSLLDVAEVQDQDDREEGAITGDMKRDKEARTTVCSVTPSFPSLLFLHVLHCIPIVRRP